MALVSIGSAPTRKGSALVITFYLGVGVNQVGAYINCQWVHFAQIITIDSQLGQLLSALDKLTYGAYICNDSFIKKIVY